MRPRALPESPHLRGTGQGNWSGGLGVMLWPQLSRGSLTGFEQGLDGEDCAWPRWFFSLLPIASLCSLSLSPSPLVSG